MELKKNTKNFQTNQPIARYPDLNKPTVRENVTTNNIFDNTKKLFLTFPVWNGIIITFKGIFIIVITYWKIYKVMWCLGLP